MKQASLLITLCALLSLSAAAQTTTIEKNAKRITITTTKVDENGKAVTETWIAEGDQPEEILQQMAVNPDVMQKMNAEDQAIKADGERLFIFRSAGDKTQIEGVLSNDISVNQDVNHDENIQKIIIIDGKGDKANTEKLYQKVYSYGGDPVHAEVWARGSNEKSNCAALGVYVNSDGAEDGARINALIEKGGAKDAGLLPGDLITKIDDNVVTDFPTLHEALSHYVSGDIVIVRYIRDDKNQKAKVELRDWAQLPGHEWRARTDCGHPTAIVEDPIVDKIDNEGGISGVPSIQPLELQDVSVYPNPTDGVFAFSFRTTPGPIAIAITDVNGKVVYHENNDNASGSYNRDLDLKGMPQGNYVITVTQGDKIFTQQISKQ